MTAIAAMIGVVSNAVGESCRQSIPHLNGGRDPKPSEKDSA
jgi:hypothetical protein